MQFNASAFDRLVIPAERKRLIEALVLSHRAGEPPPGASGAKGGPCEPRADVIEGKGEGAIFLLHGPPGVGKTLTAEAIAELLERPLYAVSMGELGTSPEALEERLTDVLDLCAPWGEPRRRLRTTRRSEGPPLGTNVAFMPPSSSCRPRAPLLLGTRSQVRWCSSTRRRCSSSGAPRATSCAMPWCA